MCFLHLFNKCTLYAQSQTPSVSARTCGLTFDRLRLPQYSSVHIRDHRVRFTDCGAKVFPVLGSATSTEVLLPLQCLGCSDVPIHCYTETLISSFFLYCSVSLNRVT